MRPTTPFALIALPLALAACALPGSGGFGGEQAGPIVPLNPIPPVFCYSTLAKPVCFSEPQPALAERFIAGDVGNVPVLNGLVRTSKAGFGPVQTALPDHGGLEGPHPANPLGPNHARVDHRKPVAPAGSPDPAPAAPEAPPATDPGPADDAAAPAAEPGPTPIVPQG